MRRTIYIKDIREIERTKLNHGNRAKRGANIEATSDMTVIMVLIDGPALSLDP